MARRRFKELLPTHEEHGIALDDEGVGVFLRHRGHHRRDPLGRARFENEKLDAERERPRLCFTTHHGRGWVRWIDEKRDASRCREHLGQNLEPLAAQLRVHDREPIGLALRRFKKLLERSGIQKELRKRKYYEKPCEARRRAELRKQSAIRKAKAQGTRGKA